MAWDCPDHAKFDDAEDRLGRCIFRCWARLVAWFCTGGPRGDYSGAFRGTSPRRIAQQARYQGDPEEFVRVLHEVGLFDQVEEDGETFFALHDFADNNPHVAGTISRISAKSQQTSEAGRRSGEVRRRKAKERTTNGERTKVNEAEREANGKEREANENEPPSPTPSPCSDSLRESSPPPTPSRRVERCEEGLPAPSTPEEVRERHRLAEEIQARWNEVARALGPPLVESVVIDDVRRVEEALWRHEDVRSGILEGIGRIESHGVASWRRKPLKLLDLCDPSKLGNCLNGSWTGEYQQPQAVEQPSPSGKVGAEFEAWALGELSRGVIHRTVEHPSPAHFEAIKACGGWRVLGEARATDIPRLLKPGRQVFEGMVGG